MKFQISNFKFQIDRRGASLVELLIAVGVAAVFLPALLTGLVASRNGKAQESQRLQAVALLKEAEEATRIVREKGWVAFAVNGTFHPAISGSNWTLTSGEELIDGYIRKIVISDVSRDSAGKIATTGGSVDPSTKEADISVSWTTPIAAEVSTTLYFTRYLDNLSYAETTRTQFNAAGNSQTNVKVQPTAGSGVANDGEIVLAQSGGYGDWCTPKLSFTDLDLPKSGVANAVSVIVGQAAAGTGDNASGVSYANVTISDPSFPTAPTASISGTFDGYKTNAVFTDKPNVNENYAYLATDNNSKEVVIIDLTSKNAENEYQEIGSFNAPGNGSGNAAAVSGNIGYMISGNKFFTFDLTSHAGSRSRLNSSGGLTLSGTGVKIYISGSNAYVATTASSNQLQIINVSNPASPTIVTNISVAGGAGRDVFVNPPQNRAYLVTAKSDVKPEFFLIDLSSNAVTGSYDTHGQGDMDPKGVVAVSGGKAIIVGSGGKEYQVLSLQTESSPTYCGGLDVNSGVNGVATVFTGAQRAYSYIITGDSAAEFKIIEGGPGEGNGSYVPSGTFISAPYGPLNFSTAFNNFTANINQPVAKDVSVQVGVADAVSGSCTTGVNYTFIGTDGNGTGVGSIFTTDLTGTASISGAIPFGSFSPSYQNPGKCFRYKVILNTTDSTLTPVFKDLTVNYSP